MAQPLEGKEPIGTWLRDVIDWLLPLPSWLALRGLLRFPAIARHAASRLDARIRDGGPWTPIAETEVLNYYLRHGNKEGADRLLLYLLNTQIPQMRQPTSPSSQASTLYRRVRESRPPRTRAEKIAQSQRVMEAFSCSAVAGYLSKLYFVYYRTGQAVPQQAVEALREHARTCGCDDEADLEMDPSDPWELVRIARIIYYKAHPGPASRKRRDRPGSNGVD